MARPGSTQNQPSADPRLQQIHALLREWLPENSLRSENDVLGQLVEWLHGRDLPRIGADDEPFDWLLRGLRQESEETLGDLERALARRLARLIERRLMFLDGTSRPLSPYFRREQVVYNLLMLCTDLRRPVELADALKHLYESGWVTGDWLGADLRIVLRDAVTTNQLGAGLREIWMAMVRGEANPLLPGGPYQGYDGILFMPKSRFTIGLPFVEAIGEALTELGRQLDGKCAQRVPQFRGLIDRAIRVYPREKHSTWDLDLVDLAANHGWCDWQVWSLPVDPVIPVPGPRQGSLKGYIVFGLYRTLFPNPPDGEEREMCGGEAKFVELNDENARLGQLLLDKLEEARRGSPSYSRPSAHGVLRHAYCDAIADPAVQDELSRLDSNSRDRTSLAGQEWLEQSLTVN